MSGLCAYGEFIPGCDGITPPAGMGRRTGGTRPPGDGAGAIGCGCDTAAVVDCDSMADVVG